MSLEKQFNLSLISICVAAGLVGCGDSAAPTASSASAPVSSGVITGFGSVYVDGVRYRTDGTSFSLDEAAGTESELEVGMVVEVEGEVDPTTGEGNATTIRFEDEVEGPIRGDRRIRKLLHAKPSPSAGEAAQSPIFAAVARCNLPSS